MLRKKIAALADVDAKYHAFYTEQEDGTFLLDVALQQTDDNTDGLKKNNTDLKREKLKLQEKLDELEKEKQKQEDKLLEEKGDWETLKKNMEEAHAAALGAEKERADKALELLKASKVDLQAQNIAAEVFADPELFQHLIDGRVIAVDVDGDIQIQFTDANGQPSPTMTAEMLVAEFKANEKFKKYVKGRDSSGGGAGGGAGGAGGDATTWDKYFNPQSPDYNAMKQGDLEKENPDLYRQLERKYDLDGPLQRPATSEHGNRGGVHGHR